MRTAIFREAGKPLSIETMSDPTPGPREVVIKVGRCGICGSDLTFTDPHSPAHYAAGSALGHEYAGEIVALGRDVSHLAVGDRVTAIPMTGCGSCPACQAGDPIACTQCRYIMGGFGEYTVADAAYVVRLPAGLSLTDGALVEPLACGAQAARLAEVEASSRVLVIGIGAIGLGAIYWARRAGCESIVASGQSDRRAELARQMGASAFIRHDSGFAAAVAEQLGGPPDIVFECSGAPGMVSEAIDNVGPRGTVLAAGFCFQPQPLVAAGALSKQIKIQFSLAYNLGDFQRAVDTLDAGFVEPAAMVSDIVALNELPETLESLRHDRSRTKVMVDPWA